MLLSTMIKEVHSGTVSSLLQRRRGAYFPFPGFDPVDG